MRVLFLFVVIAMMFVISSCNQDQSGNVDHQKIEELLNEYQIESDPGMAISIFKAGKNIYKKNRGYANLEHMVAITDSTKFVVGSISKQFTAISILLLEDEGKLSIEDDIAKYLPELQGLEYQVTIKQFLNHTSGFRNTTDLNNMKGRVDEDLTSQAEMVDLLLRQKGLNSEPGSIYRYCNASYVLLAEIVERVSGMSFAEFTNERIFKPLKMENSLFLDDPSLVVKNKAISYGKDGDNYYYIPLNRSIVGSTGLHTTVGDLGLWASNFDNMTIGNKRIFEKMENKSSLNNGEIIPYALGQELKMYKGLDVVFHGGGDAGFVSYLLRVPEHNLSIVISGNSSAFNPLKLSYGLVDIFLADYIQEPLEKELPQYTNEDLRKFEGDYQVFPGLYITIQAEGNQLYFKGYGSDSKLVLPVLGEGEFEFTARQESRIKFYKDSLTWHFSDFYYPGIKVAINPPNYNVSELNDYKGIYESTELETSYEFVVKDNKLVATHNFNPDIEFRPIADDVFISDEFYFGRVEFARNKAGNISSCKASGQDSQQIFFSKR